MSPDATQDMTFAISAPLVAVPAPTLGWFGLLAGTLLLLLAGWTGISRRVRVIRR